MNIKIENSSVQIKTYLSTRYLITKMSYPDPLFQQTNQKYQSLSVNRIQAASISALTETSYYPKSALIDHYYLDQIKNQNNRCSLLKEKDVRFTGDSENNIKMIIKSLDSINLTQNKIMMQKEKAIIENQFTSILKIFYRKIEQITLERDSVTIMLEACKNQFLNVIKNTQLYLQQLKEEIACLKKEKKSLMDKLLNQSKKKRYFERQNLILQQKQKLSTIYTHQNCNFVCGSVLNTSQSSNITKNFPSSFLGIQVQNQFQSKKQQKIVQKSKKDFGFRDLYELIKKSDQKQNQKDLASKIIQQQKKKLENLLRKQNLKSSQLKGIIKQYLKKSRQNDDIQFQNGAKKRRQGFQAEKLFTKVSSQK